MHGYPRATGDIDILINPTQGNAHKIYDALRKFGAPPKEAVGRPRDIEDVEKLRRQRDP